jgi:hypothetical protein
MARGPLTFRQGDVTRAVKAVVAAGVEIARVEIDKSGKIVIVPKVANTPVRADADNEWDEVLAHGAPK